MFGALGLESGAHATRPRSLRKGREDAIKKLMDSIDGRGDKVERMVQVIAERFALMDSNKVIEKVKELWSFVVQSPAETMDKLMYVECMVVVCIAIKPLIDSVGPVGMAWLVAGGLCYTGGVAFYLMKRRFSHFTWHLFVMAGSICHVIAVITGVLGDQ